MAAKDLRSRENGPRTAGRMRMRELVRAAGVPKSTILFYLAAGLLPPPLRTGPNSAWYDPGCVARIALIRRLQRQERLSLAEIAARLQGEKKRRLPGLPPRPPGGAEAPAAAAPRERACDAAAFSRATGISRGLLDRLVRRGLLVPGRDGRFAAADIAAGCAIGALLEEGCDWEDLGEYADAAERLALLEQRLLGAVPGGTEEARRSASARLTALRRHLFVDRLGDRLSRRHEAAAGRDRARDAEPWLD